MYRNGIDICTEVGLITKHVPKWMSFCTEMVMYRNGTPLVPKRTCTEQDPTRLIESLLMAHDNTAILLGVFIGFCAFGNLK